MNKLKDVQSISIVTECAPTHYTIHIGLMNKEEIIYKFKKSCKLFRTLSTPLTQRVYYTVEEVRKLDNSIEIDIWEDKGVSTLRFSGIL